jgi:hypothetical protein
LIGQTIAIEHSVEDANKIIEVITSMKEYGSDDEELNHMNQVTSSLQKLKEKACDLQNRSAQAEFSI